MGFNSNSLGVYAAINRATQGVEDQNTTRTCTWSFKMPRNHADQQQSHQSNGEGTLRRTRSSAVLGWTAHPCQKNRVKISKGRMAHSTKPSPLSDNKAEDAVGFSSLGCGLLHQTATILGQRGQGRGGIECIRMDSAPVPEESAQNFSKGQMAYATNPSPFSDTEAEDAVVEPPCFCPREGATKVFWKRATSSIKKSRAAGGMRSQ